MLLSTGPTIKHILLGDHLIISNSSVSTLTEHLEIKLVGGNGKVLLSLVTHHQTTFRASAASYHRCLLNWLYIFNQRIG